MCKAIIRSAVRYCDDERECVGFVCGGDANITLAPWITAFKEQPGWQLTFEEPQFLLGVGHKHGDLMVAATRRGADLTVYDNKCRVAG